MLRVLASRAMPQAPIKIELLIIRSASANGYDRDVFLLVLQLPAQQSRAEACTETRRNQHAKQIPDAQKRRSEFGAMQGVH
jgi:hypothetical protein